MNPSTLTIACALRVGEKTVELVVLRDDPAWRWEVWFAGQKLDVGAATTRLAGQLAAQCAFERRIKRAGLVQRGFSGYRWNDAQSANRLLRQPMENPKHVEEDKHHRQQNEENREAAGRRW